MPCDCIEARALRRLREWLVTEIQDWKRAHQLRRHGLNDFEEGTLEAFQTAYVMSFDPEEFEKPQGVK